MARRSIHLLRSAGLGSGLLVLLALGAGAGCLEEAESDCCPVGMQRVCLCQAGDESLQQCGPEGWGSCDCGCQPWASRPCLCEGGEDGLQVCGDDGVWGQCGCQGASFPDTWDGTCAVGETLCEGVGCVNTAHSEANCGACGVACEGCDRCIRGECTPSCCPDETNCGTTRDPLCVHLPIDVDNCGACGAACAGDERCVGGVCML